MAGGYVDLHSGRSSLQRYGFAVVCIAIALGLALILGRYGVRGVELPVFALFRFRHLVCRSRAFSAGCRAVHGRFQLLFY
jgi:hypothetical protein